MSTAKLTYFDIDGGRAEPVRVLLKTGNISFEDVRISFEEFGQMREGTPLSAVPTFEIDGVQYTQTNAMLRYVGKRTGHYPEDPWQAFLCDELLGATEDLLYKVVNTFGLDGDELKAARKELVNGMITRYIKLVDNRLAASGGRYLADNRLTIADLRVFLQLRSLSAGVLDHVPTNIVEQVAPQVAAYCSRMEKEPVITDYYNNR